ncbi:class I SAM-dependent methyltransferase [Limnoglobus roseus]|uniref:class I SAM-dependent methyltransferase n=1 Tax=Limnoglobus roseus TaxID=2598579 RepID=UPI00143CEE16|nr:class I SAM-dependent methyltransferase [Limnoglobus roseus]
MEEWYDETERHNMVGECTVPLVSIVQGFVGGSGITRIVQCGHYVGYSTLMLGFLLRHMGRKQSLFSIDIDPLANSVSQRWVDRAQLNEQVHLELGDSSDLSMPARATKYLGGTPQLVIIDSSHEYHHTIRELNLWYDVIPPHAMILLHDTSIFAAPFDSGKNGGVRQALADWAKGKPVAVLNLNESFKSGDGNDLVYADPCGIGLIHKLA